MSRNKRREKLPTRLDDVKRLLDALKEPELGERVRAVDAEHKRVWALREELERALAETREEKLRSPLRHERQVFWARAVALAADFGIAVLIRTLLWAYAWIDSQLPVHGAAADSAHRLEFLHGWGLTITLAIFVVIAAYDAVRLRAVKRG